MTATGRVREWHREEGWGVIDSADTPGGCWAHFSMVRIDGYQELSAGAEVCFTFEEADQDGFAYRVVAVWPAGTTPTAEPAPDMDPSAYRGGLFTTAEGVGPPEGD